MPAHLRSLLEDNAALSHHLRQLLRNRSVEMGPTVQSTAHLLQLLSLPPVSFARLCHHPRSSAIQTQFRHLAKTLEILPPSVMQSAANECRALAERLGRLLRTRPRARQTIDKIRDTVSIGASEPLPHNCLPDALRTLQRLRTQLTLDLSLQTQLVADIQASACQR